MSAHERAPAKGLYDRVERIRLARGWTKVQMAQHLNVARGTLENWKTQRRVPLAPTVTSVADKLGIDREEALRLAGILMPGDASQDPRIAEIERSPVFTDEEKGWLIDRIRSMPPPADDDEQRDVS